VPAPPDKGGGRGRHPAHLGRDTYQQQTPTPTTGTTGVILAQRPDRVVDLDAWRLERLLAPWPGWWGGAELHSWTWAERSRGRWSA